MKNNKTLTKALLLMLIVSVVVIAVPTLILAVEAEQPTMTIDNINRIDVEGGDEGWSPIHVLKSGEIQWDSVYGGSYRHLNDEFSTPYGVGTRLRADSNHVTDLTDSTSFYQYLRVDVPYSYSSGYKLHLDFYLQEDSSTTLSSIDNWRIAILNGRSNTLAERVFWQSQSDCDNHGVFIQETFDIQLNYPEIYILIGHGDGWNANYYQGHTKYFNEISIWAESETLIPTESTTVTDFMTDMSFPNTLGVSQIDEFGLDINADGLLKFNLTGIHDISSAKLQVYCMETLQSNVPVVISALNNYIWDADHLTWSIYQNDNPSRTLINQITVNPDTMYEIDVTSWITQHENSEVSFVFEPSGTSSYEAEFYTGSGNIHQVPRLILEGDYWLESYETERTTVESFVPIMSLYNPPGDDSYIALTRTDQLDVSIAHGFESEQVAIFYSHLDYNYETTKSVSIAHTISTESDDPRHVGYAGDVFVGYGTSYELIVHGYYRHGETWGSYLQTTIEVTNVYEDTRISVIRRCDAESLNMNIVEDCGLKYNEEATSEDKMIRWGPISPNTPVVGKLSYSIAQSHNVHFEVGIFIKTSAGLSAGAEVTFGIECKLAYTLTWQREQTTTWDMEYRLCDSEEFLYATLCSENSLQYSDYDDPSGLSTMTMIELDSPNYWFYYG